MPNPAAAGVIRFGPPPVFKAEQIELGQNAAQ